MSEPSPFFDAWSDTLLEAARLGPVTDVACGRGRHALAAAARGAACVGLDRDPAALAELAAEARARALPLLPVRADVESEAGLPLAPGCAGAVLVFRFLHRPGVERLAGLLKPGGLLLYETFTIHQRDLGYGPRNPDFLLEPGELPRLFPGLVVLESSEGLVEDPRPRHVARLAARRP